MEKPTTRRTFLKGAALGAIGAAALTIPGVSMLAKASGTGEPSSGGLSGKAG